MATLAKRIQTLSPSLTLAISAKAKAMKAAGEDVINFGVGEPDFSTPQYIVEAAFEAIEEGQTKYTPAAGTLELRRAIAEKLLRENGLSYSPEEIVVSNGAKQCIFNACYALVDEGDEVIIPAPYWLTYPEIVKTLGGVPVFIGAKREKGFKISPEELRAAITPRTKLLIFNSPCNPTGAVYSEEEIRALAAVCEEAGIFVLSDEIYEKLVYGGAKPFSFAAVSAKMKSHTVTVNGVSKTYAMTGWRIGYLAAPPEIAKAIASFQSHATGNPNAVAQHAAMRALSVSDPSIADMVSAFSARRAKMLERISHMEGAECVVPDGAFYVMLVVEGTYGKCYRGKKIQNSVDFAEALLAGKKVAVVPGAAFGAGSCVRLSYSLSMEEMLEGLRRIDEFLKEIKNGGAAI